MLREGKVYVPKDEELRAEVIRLHHDVPAVEHGRRWKTVELVTRNYWWPGVTRDVGKYVEGCDLCQRMKNSVMDIRTLIIFISFSFIFSDFTFLFLCLLFYFPGKTMKKARDKEVT